ncbi:MAG: hypothetical protein P0Y65_01270 [Candidatus Devosia phytovorans]|uniref:Outer membrane protein beta-barrel domain-containing protein n=1 Tax=Candidatus Devosia phytovorans TaxID=3121372 RepID=A0AAJ6B141_9HYPH|nr:hypothetical protein [Devosia sp.]WEK04914.1 MAG: hypothetical protein P0Y65_01270 [Devosia sp.]
MRKFIAAIMVAGATLVAGSAVAADFPYYPPVIEIPDVDYGVQSSFYLRGSAAGNALWAKEANAYECVTCTTLGEPGTVLTQFPFETWGYGYSVGAGFGYETGTGLRFDATIDYVDNDGLSVIKGPEFGTRAGEYTARLRTGLALANAYYDFSFGDYGYGAAGGAFGYVGAGAGIAHNRFDITSPATSTSPADSGSNTSPALAAMVGVGYDFGSVVADIGYRGVYIAQIGNGLDAPLDIYTNNNWLHEIRTSLRYRFN